MLRADGPLLTHFGETRLDAITAAALRGVVGEGSDGAGAPDLGEATALTWGQVGGGADENDRTRKLTIDRNRPRGGAEELTKSGRSREVALSRRLRRALAALYDLQFRPGPEVRVLPGFDPQNFAHRDWRRTVKRAAIGHREPKDLRDTFASWLLSLSVQLACVSEQLGYADVAVTARHYAKWCGGNVYRDPMPLLPGEAPADLVARIVEEAAESPQLHTTVSDVRPECGAGEADEPLQLTTRQVGTRGLERPFVAVNCRGA